MGKVSHPEKMRMQRLREQGCGSKAIICAYPYKEWKLSTVLKICRRIDTTGYAAERKAGSGRPKSVRTAPNIDRVEELICSQEGAAETHHRTRQIAAELNISERSARRIAREDLHLISFRRVPRRSSLTLCDRRDGNAPMPINKAVKDFAKRLKACVQVNGEHFEHLCDIESGISNALLAIIFQVVPFVTGSC